MFIERLFDKLWEIVEFFMFWTVIRVFERGVVLRFGAFHKEVGADGGVRFPYIALRQFYAWGRTWVAPCIRFGDPTGLHWILPFGLDDVIVDNVVPRTVSLSAQSLTTSDGKQIVVSAVVTASIRHIRKALLEVEGVDHALMDSCYAAIAQSVAGAEWAALATNKFNEDLTKSCRAQAWRYGIEIERVQLSDLSMCRAIRLHTTNHYSAPLGEQ